MIKDIILKCSVCRVTYRAIIWHLKYITGRVPSPLGCGLFITTRCNFKCDFCNFWRIKPADQMSEADTKKIMKELGRMGLIYLAVGGGEPLLVPYVFDILAYAKKSGILFTHLVSNGFLMDENKAKELKKASVSEISFSLDGDEIFHEKNRAKNQSFKKVIEAVHHVKIHAPGTDIVLNTILDPACPENAVDAVKIAERLQVKIKVQPINQQLSFGTEISMMNCQHPLQADEKRKFFSAIDEIQKSPYVCNTPAFLENYKAFLFSPDYSIFNKNKCIFGFHHLEIFHGQLFPCVLGLYGENGVELSKKSVKDILYSQEYDKKRQDLKKCTECGKNYYICYYEPRLNFPIWNFIKSRLYRYDTKSQTSC